MPSVKKISITLLTLAGFPTDWSLIVSPAKIGEKDFYTTLEHIGVVDTYNARQACLEGN